MPGATERIAAKLAARQAAQAAEPADDQEPEEPEVDEAEELVGSDEAESRPSLAERAKAARAARSTKSNGPAGQAKPAAKTAGKAKAAPGKKQPSPAQLAAREKFAAASRERAAAKKAGAEPEKKQPLQTEAEVKASQAAARKAAAASAKAEAEAKSAKKAVGTSRPVVVKKGKAPAAAPTKSKAAPAKAKKAAGAAKPQSDTKAKVLELWSKGQTRRQIMEKLGLSYPAVFFHTKGVEGAGAGVRGRIFVDTNLDEDGRKMARGKTEKVSRSEVMRRMYLSGEQVGDIARSFDIRYQVAYTAIRPLLGDVEEAE